MILHIDDFLCCGQMDGNRGLNTKRQRAHAHQKFTLNVGRMVLGILAGRPQQRHSL